MFNRKLEKRIERLEDKTSFQVRRYSDTGSGWCLLDYVGVKDVLIELLSVLDLEINGVKEKKFKIIKTEKHDEED